MFDMIRDVSAVHTLTHELGRLREAYLEAVLSGTDPEDSFWAEGEERAFAVERERHFSRPVRIVIDPEDKRTDEKAWEDRECVLAEEVALWSHRRLVEIPFVGDGTHDAPEDSAELAPGDQDGAQGGAEASPGELPGSPDPGESG
jgi:hypothetical protein